MVATHAVDAFLAEAWREGIVWHLTNLMFGFAGPAFLMVAGITLGLRIGSMQGSRAGARRRILRRMLGVLMLGYWLQIPVLSLRRLVVEQRPEDMARMFDSNILHVIALASIAIVLISTLSDSPVRMRIVVGALAFVVIMATPYIWASGIYRDHWLPIRSFVAPQPIALFPLFPYAFHLLAGFLLTPILLALDRHSKGWLIMLGAGCALIATGFGIDTLIGGIPPHDDFWGSGIGHVLFRSGGVIAALGLCIGISRSIGERTSALERIGRRSLGIYTLHLIVIYGSPMTIGLRTSFDGIFHRAYSPAAVIVIAAAVTLLCYQALRGWEWARVRYPALCSWATGVWWTWFVLRFVAG
jgi:surface polysaccharide O-acyltransferase-like enzyme